LNALPARTLAPWRGGRPRAWRRSARPEESACGAPRLRWAARCLQRSRPALGTAHRTSVHCGPSESTPHAYGIMLASLCSAWTKARWALGLHTRLGAAPRDASRVTKTCKRPPGCFARCHAPCDARAMLTVPPPARRAGAGAAVLHHVWHRRGDGPGGRRHCHRRRRQRDHARQPGLRGGHELQLRLCHCLLRRPLRAHPWPPLAVSRCVLAADGAGAAWRRAGGLPIRGGWRTAVL